MQAEKSVLVWDLPTRVFHWSLVVLVLIGWFSGEGEGVAQEIHRYSGEAIVGLLVFRFIWGFIGGEHARFSSFIASPRDVVTHIRELFSFKAERTIGHNPLGAISSVVLMLLVAATAATGLFSASDHGLSGPFAGAFNVNFEEIHEVFFRVLQAMVLLHLAGVATTSFASRDNLVLAMITGHKQRASDEPAHDAKKAPKTSLYIAGTLAVVAAAILMTLPHAAAPGEHDARQENHDYDEHDNDSDH